MLLSNLHEKTLLNFLFLFIKNANMVCELERLYFEST